MKFDISIPTEVQKTIEFSASHQKDVQKTRILCSYETLTAMETVVSAICLTADEIRFTELSNGLIDQVKCILIGCGDEYLCTAIMYLISLYR